MPTHTTSGPIQNTVIVQVIVRTEHVGSIKFSTRIEDTLNLGKFFDETSRFIFSNDHRENISKSWEACCLSSY
jgi:hypothetical protein